MKDFIIFKRVVSVIFRQTKMTQYDLGYKTTSVGQRQTNNCKSLGTLVTTFGH